MSNVDRPSLEDKIAEWGAQGRVRLELESGQMALSSIGADLDDKINLRVNSVLKTEFEKVCKSHHTTLSREIKRFMTEVVRTQRVT